MCGAPDLYGNGKAHSPLPRASPSGRLPPTTGQDSRPTVLTLTALPCAAQEEGLV